MLTSAVWTIDWFSSVPTWGKQAAGFAIMGNTKIRELGVFKAAANAGNCLHWWGDSVILRLNLCWGAAKIWQEIDGLFIGNCQSLYYTPMNCIREDTEFSVCLIQTGIAHSPALEVMKRGGWSPESTAFHAERHRLILIIFYTKGGSVLFCSQNLALKFCVFVELRVRKRARWVLSRFVWLVSVMRGTDTSGDRSDRGALWAIRLRGHSCHQHGHGQSWLGHPVCACLDTTPAPREGSIFISHRGLAEPVV